MAQPGTTFTTTDPALWIVTSLTAGSSHIVTATSRLETILRANRVPFKAVDISTDNKARMVWGRRAGKDANGRLRKLPGLVQQGVVLGDLVEIEEWNEYGELKEKVKIYFDDYTIPTKAEAEKMPALRAMTRPPGGAKPTSVPAATAKPAPTSGAAASVANAMATAASIAAKHAQMKEKELSKVTEIKKEDPPVRSIADEAADKAKSLRLQNLRKQVAESKKKDDEIATAAAAAAAAAAEEKDKDKETSGEAEPKITNEKTELDTTEDASHNVETAAKAATSSIETKDEPSAETELQEKAPTKLETPPVKVVLVTPPPEEGSVPQEVVKPDESKADSEAESGTADATENIEADTESDEEGEPDEDEDDSDSGSEISDSDYDSDASQQREVDDMLPEEYDRLRQALQEPAKWSSPLENDARSIAETMDLSDDDAPRSISESLARLSRSNSAMSLRERVRADKERETFEMEREWQKLVLVGKAEDLDRANSLSGGPDSPALSLAAGMRSPSGLSAKDGPVSPVSSKTPGTPTVLVDSKTRSRDKHSLAVESRKDRATGKTSSRSQHKSREEKRDMEKTKSSSSTGGASKSKSVSKPKTKSARDDKDKENKLRSADKDREAAKKKKSSGSSKDKDKEKEKEKDKKIDKAKSSRASVAEKTPKSP